mgnify:CR=1 FL=1
MAKIETRFVCQQCGYASVRQLGRCPQCGGWGTMVEEVVSPAPERTAARPGSFGGEARPVRLSEVRSDANERIPLPMEEFSRVLGGGIVPGSVVLVGGDPGIGKSTLLLQLALGMGSERKVLYVSGEESDRQIKMRAQRLSAANGHDEPIPPELYLLTETDLESILAQTELLDPELVIIDSIQTMSLAGLTSLAGSITQVRECAARLREMAKSSGRTVFLVSHVTKEGIIAGPKVLEHIVDTVLYLEGERYHAFRLLRAVKNRFGATSEVGVFEMGEEGLREVPNPSEVFLAERTVNTPGSAVTVSMEGTRPILVEVQGLTSPTSLGIPRRTPIGVDLNRLHLITAVLTRRLGLRLADQDVFVNVIGGLRVSEPAADLAIAAALASSMRDNALPADMVFIGEVGLSGELRSVGHMAGRLKEAQRLGFRRAVIARGARQGEAFPQGISVLSCRSLREAFGQLFTREAKPVDSA